LVDYFPSLFKMVVLREEEEFALLMYIINYDICTPAMRRTIAETVRRLGQRVTMTVYRGQASEVITRVSPFFSTTPNIEMARLFQPVDWDSPGEPRLCCLIAIHLVDVPVLSTRGVTYTLSERIRRRYEQTPGVKPWERVRGLLDELVFTDTVRNGEEIIVLNEGFFTGTRRRTPTDYETWYYMK